MSTPEHSLAWWETVRPSLSVYEEPVVVGDISRSVIDRYDAARAVITSRIRSAFATRDAAMASLPREVAHPVVLNSIYLDLPRSLFSRLAEANTEAEFRLLCQHELPEVDKPFVFSRGNSEKGTGLNSNFLNVFFLQSDEWPLAQFSTDQRIYFMQSMLAKFGSFKSLYVLCDESDASFSSVYLSTLEGGHPSFTHDRLDELSRRLRVFGSAQSADVAFDSSARTVSDSDWQRSLGVNQLRRLGLFAGEYDLLSAPVVTNALVRNPSLARLIARVGSFAQMAEGAMYVYDPELCVATITASGKFGAVKTNLTSADLLGVEIDVAHATLRRVGIDVSSSKGPSVEGKEFLWPLIGLMRDSFLRIRRVPHGYVDAAVDDPRGVVVPPIRGIFHTHRDIRELLQYEEAIVIDQNIALRPPVGCGVNLMEQISAGGMHDVVDAWNRSGRRLRRAFLRVANHGLNDIELWSKNEHGVYPLDPYSGFRRGVRSSRYRLTRDIEQR